MEIINFSSCSTEWLENTFGLELNENLTLINDWIETSKSILISEFEQNVLLHYQKILHTKVDDWNEKELSEHFIGPIISFVNFNTKKFSSFADRPIKAEIGDYILQGNPDLMICTGKSVPRQPYFCFHEYKKSLENQGDPKGQLLAAMITAQKLNTQEIPIYGIYVTGRIWYFVVLNKKEFCVTNGHNATKKELFEIFQLLKQLKNIIINFTK